MDHEDKAGPMDVFFSMMLGTASERLFSLDLDVIGIPTHDLHHLNVEFTEEQVWMQLERKN